MRQVADARAVGVDDEIAARRNGETGEHSEQRRLPASVRPRDEREAPDGDREIYAVQHALPPVALLEAATPDHATSTSRATKAKNTTLITPFIVKNAASSLRRSPGRTSECS